MCFMSRDQNPGKDYKIKTDGKSFERMQKFKHGGTALISQSYIHDEIKSCLKLGLLLLVFSYLVSPCFSSQRSENTKHSSWS